MNVKEISAVIPKSWIQGKIERAEYELDKWYADTFSDKQRFLLPLEKAISVMLLDKRISGWLKENDPQAYLQAVSALTGVVIKL